MLNLEVKFLRGAVDLQPRLRKTRFFQKKTTPLFFVFFKKNGSFFFLKETKLCSFLKNAKTPF